MLRVKKLNTIALQFLLLLSLALAVAEETILCGTRSAVHGGSRVVVTGKDAKPGLWPWQAALYREPDTRVTCGGTIVSRDWIVSAGHCFFGPYRDPLKWKVALGLVDTAVPEHWAQRSGVDKLYVHEQFFNPDNDIALLHLSSPAEFNDYVRPACLPCTGTSNTDEWSNCYVTGFGLFSETGAQGVVLQQAGMKLIPSDECKSKEMYGAYVNDNMVCAGFAGGVEDTCQANSGGPLVCKLKGGSGVFRLVGAVSWARGCANRNKPGVYSSVSRYVEWIANTTGVAAEVLQGETTPLMCH
ncbi:transmembrane protease serine 11C-like [Acipenser oxyrinchus oxyrinchus]|uniref:Transmembrane protease serine 11C-like n=1 Tax=Acipenser oxyrinchus oxyrinchus TaxID=40147 RepID=A0AAD8FXG5_ACIOX|nr:transmembrane protease serine 11C-like [Acipenser oxyrinchus oxyrinchus]